MTEESLQEQVRKTLNGIKGHCDVLKEEGFGYLDLPFNAPGAVDRAAAGAAGVPVAANGEPRARGKEQSVQPSSPATDVSAHRAPGATPVSAGEKREQLEVLQTCVKACTRCQELAASRHSVVFGSGTINARLLFVGEAPGYDEDLQGEPFVGRAGQLLTKYIESIGLKRQHVFIANVLKCRPPENRNPRPEEILNCEEYLVAQLAIIKPMVICALGTFAAQTLLHTKEPISKLRGSFHDYHGVKVLPTFHPAFVLRSPNYEQHVLEDFKRLKEELLRTAPAR